MQKNKKPWNEAELRKALIIRGAINQSKIHTKDGSSKARLDYIWKQAGSFSWGEFRTLVKKYCKCEGYDYYSIKLRYKKILDEFAKMEAEKPPEEPPQKETWCPLTYPARVSTTMDAKADAHPD